MATATLEEVCFNHIVRTLEEYNIEELALLPESYRRKLLLRLPILDVCRLEGTQFTEGLDMDSIWEQLHRALINQSTGSPRHTWKDHFFETLISFAFKDKPMYPMPSALRKSSVISDSLKCLVSLPLWQDHKDETTPKGGLETKNESQKRYCSTKVRRLVQKLRESARNNISYEKICPEKQRIPPRYVKYCSCCELSNTTTVDLIREKCHFYPKAIDICTHTFDNYFKETLVQDSLAEFLKDVETLCISDNQSSDVDRVALMSLFVSNPHGQLSSLAIRIANRKPNTVSSSSPHTTQPPISHHLGVIESMETVLVSYCGLKELTICAQGSVSVDFQKLMCISRSQTYLHTVSIELESEHKLLGNVAAAGRVRRLSTIYVEPEYSLLDLYVWLKSCIKEAIHVCLSIRLSTDNQLPRKDFDSLEVLKLFLSTPSAHEHEHTLTFSNMKLRTTQQNKAATTLYLYLTLTPVSLPRHFDVKCTQNKSLIFDSCEFGSLFTKALFNLPPLKLKQLIVRSPKSTKELLRRETQVEGKDEAQEDLFANIAMNPNIDMESLELNSLPMDSATFMQYKSLLQKKSLTKVTLVQCTGVDSKALERAAIIHSFSYKEETPSRATVVRICRL